jgi:hypothetical protein
MVIVDTGAWVEHTLLHRDRDYDALEQRLGLAVVRP